jgi:hypothetical protein
MDRCLDDLAVAAEDDNDLSEAKKSKAYPNEGTPNSCRRLI